MKPISGNIFTSATEDTFIIQVKYSYSISLILLFIVFIAVLIFPFFVFEVVHPVFNFIWPAVIVVVAVTFFFYTYDRKREYKIDFKNNCISYQDYFAGYKTNVRVVVDRLNLFRLAFHVENKVDEDYACYYLTATNQERNLEIPVLRIYDIKLFLKVVTHFNEAFPGKRILEYFEKV